MSKSRVKVCSIVLLIIVSTLLLAGISTFARSETELKEIAATDFIPEIREAAALALSKLYLESDMTVEELEEVATTTATEELKEAAVPALAGLYGDVSEITTSEEAQKIAENLEKRAVEGENPQIREAAGIALANFYTSFGVKGVEGYAAENLEEIAKNGETEALKNAAVEALSAIYPNIKTSEELKTLIAETESDKIKRAASEALAIRYVGPFPPSPSLEELKTMAANLELDKWVRAAAGNAFGQLSAGKLSMDELANLAKSGQTMELQSGAGMALAKALIESEKTEQELVGMVVAASTAETEAYRNSLIEALADRYVNL